MNKKIASLAAGLVLAISFSACGAVADPLPVLAFPTPEPTSSGAAASGTASAASSSEAATSSGAAPAVDLEGLDAKEVEDNLEGLCQFLEGNYAVSGNKEEMSYGEIGAKGGFRYRFTYNNSTVQVEVYEFDLKNLDEKAQTCLDEVKEKGTFTMLNQQVPAVLNNDGKYMMVYTDGKNEDANNQQKERVKELFLSFKTNES